MESNGNSVANLKAMFEKKPAENPIPMKKTAGAPAAGKAPPKEEKKVETIEPQSVSSLKSVFGFEKKATDTATTGTALNKPSTAPQKDTTTGGANPFAKKPVEETKVQTTASGAGTFPWNKKPVEEKPQASNPPAVTSEKPSTNPWKKDPVVETPTPAKPAAEVQAPKPLVQNNPFAKAVNTVIAASTKKPVEEPPKQVVAPPKKEEEVVKATVVENKVNNEAPKKLAVASVFQSQPKQETAFPPKKAPEPVNNNPFAKKATEELVSKPKPAAQEDTAPKDNPFKQEPKKLATPSVFGAAPKQEVKAPVKEAPKKLEIVKNDNEVKIQKQETPVIQPPAPVQATVNKSTSVQPPPSDEPPKKISKLFADDDDEEDDSPAFKPTPTAPVQAVKKEPIVQTKPLPPPPKAEPVLTAENTNASEQSQNSASDFKSSLSSLLQKGNPLSMPGMGGLRRGTTMNKKPVPAAAEEETPKQQIKFDIFNEEDGNNKGGANTAAADVTDYKKKTLLDNDDQLDKPVMVKAKTRTKKYDFFEDDE